MKRPVKKNVFHGIWGAVSALQLLLAAGAVILNRLAYRRGGVNHHVAYRKRQYNELVFTEKNIFLMQAVLILLSMLLLWLLVRALRQKRGERTALAACCLLLAGVLLFELTAPDFRAVAIYPYAVLITVVIFALEFVLLMLQSTVRD